MTIKKGEFVYYVTESAAKWIVKKNIEKLTVSVEVPKDLCQTEDALRKYVLSSDIF